MKKTYQIPGQKAAAEYFDPFNDRLSRDIRNSLSDAFVDALFRKQKSLYREAAENWQSTKPAEVYRNYIQNRLLRYDRVFEQIQANQVDDSRLQFIVIWNNELFFEVHDHLERVWSQAAGDQRQALKGLIKAAGVYIHMEHNRQKAAASLSVKAVDLIREHSRCFSFIANLDELAEIPGIGNKKRSRYGPAFVEAIRQYGSGR